MNDLLKNINNNRNDLKDKFLNKNYIPSNQKVLTK